MFSHTGFRLIILRQFLELRTHVIYTIGVPEASCVFMSHFVFVSTFSLIISLVFNKSDKK